MPKKREGTKNPRNMNAMMKEPVQLIPKSVKQDFSVELKRLQREAYKGIANVAGLQKKSMTHPLFNRLWEKTWDLMNRAYGLGQDEILYKLNSLEEYSKKTVKEREAMKRLPMLNDPFPDWFTDDDYDLDAEDPTIPPEDQNE